MQENHNELKKKAENNEAQTKTKIITIEFDKYNIDYK